MGEMRAAREDGTFLAVIAEQLAAFLGVSCCFAFLGVLGARLLLRWQSAGANG